jgi:alpha-galactosidase/6-phospho-beta-glucosidase family protein
MLILKINKKITGQELKNLLNDCKNDTKKDYIKKTKEKYGEECEFINRICNDYIEKVEKEPFVKLTIEELKLNRHKYYIKNQEYIKHKSKDYHKENRTERNYLMKIAARLRRNKKNNI